MPRQARLDAPGTLHHVIVRGIERRTIVDDDTDREEFVDRMGKIAFVLVVEEGMSMADTARLLGVTTPAISSAIRKLTN